MSIKGSATIELTNADGSKEIYKHDNMVTNAVNDLCMSQRGEMPTILKIVNNGDSYAQALFGGLLLFEDTLNSDPADYFVPSVKCTGYASQDAYAGLDTCRGSFNQSEGGVQDDGSYKFVWDFSTSQANGTIKSLALVPNMMGQIGVSSSQVYNERKSFSMNRTYVAPFTSNMVSDMTIDGFPSVGMYIVATLNDIAYVVSMDNIGFRGGSVSSDKVITNNGGILKLFRFKMGASSISLSDKVCRATYIDTVDVQLPTEFISSIAYKTYASLIAFSYDDSTKKLVAFPCSRSSDTAINATLKYCEIDLANNYATTVYTFTNNTAGHIYSSGATGAGNSNRYNFYVMKKYILTTSYTGGKTKFCIVDRSNNTQVKEVKARDGHLLQYNSSEHCMIAPIFWNENVLFAQIIQDNNTSRDFVVFDLVNGEFRTTNVTSLTYGNMLDIGDQSVFAMTGENLTYVLVFNPFILCTKNNLDSPVTKTASQTMKITYTLTVADATGSEG